MLLSSKLFGPCIFPLLCFIVGLMFAIVDYRAGNLASVARAVDYLGFRCKITDNVRDIMSSNGIIFPGVGAAGKAMDIMRNLGLDDILREAYLKGMPILGICLGTQIVFEHSEEDGAQCLGLLPGLVRRFPDILIEDGCRLKVPHMGWNRVDWVAEHPVFSGLMPEWEYYFVHSYYPEPRVQGLTAGVTGYGITFTSAVASENLVAVQFHLEKSGRPGLQILANFCKWRP